MAVGDSLTQGATELVGGYRLPLFGLNPGLILVGRNYSSGFHEGYGGYTINQISATVLPIVDTFAPSLILLMAGTNDIALGQDAASTLVEYMQLANDFKAKASVAYVIMSTIPYLFTHIAEQTAYNAALLATIPPAGIIITDASGTLTYPADFNGSHPNLAGYAKMAIGWDPSVNALLV